MATWLTKGVSAAEGLLNKMDAVVMQKLGTTEQTSHEATGMQTQVHSAVADNVVSHAEASSMSGTGYTMAGSASPFPSAAATLHSKRHITDMPFSASQIQATLGTRPSQESKVKSSTSISQLDREEKPLTSVSSFASKSGSSSNIISANQATSIQGTGTPPDHGDSPSVGIATGDTSANTTTKATPTKSVLKSDSKEQLQLPASMSASFSKTPASSAAAAREAVAMAEAAASSSSGTHGSARDAQLSRALEQLKEKLRASKLENEQLEDLLAQAEARCEREKALVTQLRSDLHSVQDGRAAREGALQAQLNQQASALQETQLRCDTLTSRVLQLDGELAVAQETSRSLMQNKSDLEGGMLESLRSQLAATETQLDAERKAHSMTRASAAARESELETAVNSNTGALSQMQHSLQEHVARISELQDRLALTESRCRELESGTGGAGGGAGGSGSTAADKAAARRVQDLEQEVERLQGELQAQVSTCRQAEAMKTAAVAEAQTLRDELQALRQATEQAAWNKDVEALQASLREAHDLIYQKQSEISRLKSDRQALQMRLERELSTGKTATAQQDHHALNMHGSDTSRSHSQVAFGGSQHSVVPMSTALGERYRKLASRQDQIGKAVTTAASVVDRTTSLLVHLLHQYPVVRLVALGYLLVLHAFVYLVTLRMQHSVVTAEEHSGSAGSQKKLP